MSHYIVNRLAGGRVHLLQNSIKLAPKGEKGDSRRIPDWARSHADVLSLEKSGKIEVLTEAQYQGRLEKRVKPAKKDDVVPVVEKKVEAPTPVSEPEPDVVEEEEEEEEVETSLALADFKQLNKANQLDELKRLGIYEDSHAEKKVYAEEAYEAYLAHSS